MEKCDPPHTHHRIWGEWHRWLLLWLTSSAMDTHSSPNSSTRSRQHATVGVVVPVVALVTTAVLQSVQSLVMQVRGVRFGMSLNDVLMQWDSQWMTLISRYGYSGFALGDAGSPGGEPIEWQSVAFFPGYPWLVRAIATPLRALSVSNGASGANGTEITTAVAIAVSVVSSVVMVWGMGLLAVNVLWPKITGDDAGPRVAAVLTCAMGVLALGAPMSVVYFMPYSEALYTALAVWTVYMVLRHRYLTAGILTFCAGLTRITAVVLVLTLAVVAVVEAWRWWQSRRGHSTAEAAFEATELAVPPRAERAGSVLRACVAPLIGSLGLAGYIAWASRQTADIGGYFAVQDRGWHSGFDAGAATWRWLTTEPLNLFIHSAEVHPGVGTGVMPGYAISSWSMILVAVLCLVSLWPLLTRRLPWQLWLPAVAVAGMTLGSDGIMHSRPRLLLITVLFLLLPLVVWLISRVVRWLPTHPWLAGLPVIAAVAWCVLGFWVSAEMLIGFTYAI